MLDGEHNVIGVSDWSVGEHEDLFYSPEDTYEQISKKTSYASDEIVKKVLGQEYDRAIDKASCTFHAEIELPRADLYQIEGRGNYTVTFDEMKENDWQLSLSLGEEW